MIQRNFKLALTAGRTIPLVIPASQYDSGEQWIFTLIDETGAKYTPATGAIIGLKSDKTAILNAGTVDAAGRVVINETEQMTAAVGKNVYEILIDDQTHGSANFIVMVEPRPGDNADFSDSDLSLLQQAIDGTSATAIAGAVTDWMDENLSSPTNPVVDSSLTVSGAAADAKKTGDEISDLKSALDEITVGGVDAVVEQWLDDHPEATTTVQDGSLTEAKLTNDLAIKSVEDCVVPSIFASGDVSDGTDITQSIISALASTDSDVVKVPAGTYRISSTVNIPAGKTLKFEGDYHNDGIQPTILVPASAGLTMFSLNSSSSLIGGLIQLGSVANVKAVKLDCHNQGIARASVRNTKITGGRESDRVFTQTAVYVECDDPSASATERGYLIHSLFDAYIDGCGYGYYFHRQRAAGTTSGVYLTENDIYGYIRHCTRYIFFDFASAGYANNDAIIGATLQGGSLLTGESNHPAINIFGKGITLCGKFWDFDASHQHPAVYFEQGSDQNVVTRLCSVGDYYQDNNLISRNVSLNELTRITAHRRVYVTLIEGASQYVTDLTNKSYRIGDVIYLNFQFKVSTDIPASTPLFQIADEDAFVAWYETVARKQSDASQVGLVTINSANPHNIVARTALSSSTAWVQIHEILVSNRITAYDE